MNHMYETVFILNNRYKVDRPKNEILDTQAGQIHQVEFRLMELLCILAGNAGSVVTRKKIIGELWHDYPGGNESLNQAISYLRKILEDDKKNIIQTVPKRGYKLTADISTENEAVTIKNNRKRKKLFVQALILFVILVIALLYFVNNNTKTTRQNADKQKLIEMSKADSLRQATKQ